MTAYDNWKTRSPDDGHYDPATDEDCEPEEEETAMAKFRTTPGGSLEVLGPGGTWLSVPPPAAEEIERLRGPHYLQGDGGWYAISLGQPRYCFYADTLAAVQELETRARTFHAKTNE